MQGVTAGESDTLLTDATTAASLYVGLTRGRDRNRLHIVAENLDDAKAQFVAAMERDRADRELEDAARRAAERTRGLVNSPSEAPGEGLRPEAGSSSRLPAVRRSPLAPASRFGLGADRRRTTRRREGPAIGR